MTRFPPKSILVPFDLSSLSEAAWRQAVALARSLEAQLEVVYVQDWMRAAELSSLPPPKFHSEAKREILARIRGVVGLDPKVTLASGDPVLSILRLARSHRADLIVMGTHGRAGLTRALLGSVTESVVRQSPIPVLAVRGEGSEIRSVLAPVDFTDHSYCGFEYAAAMAAALNVRLTALHVHLDPIWNGNPHDKLAKLIDRLPAAIGRACSPRVETGHSDALGGILKAAARHDVIVIVAHEKAPIKDMILGTMEERILRRSAASVLVVPAPRGALPVHPNLRRLSAR